MDTDVSRAFGIISGLRGTRFNATQTKAELTRVWRVARRSVNGTGIVSTEKGDRSGVKSYATPRCIVSRYYLLRVTFPAGLTLFVLFPFRGSAHRIKRQEV